MLKINFQDNKEPTEVFVLHEHIIEDRRSRYSVSIGKGENKEEVKAFLKTLKKNKKYAKATHNTYAVRIAKDEAIFESKNDDGEAGAGMVILRIMQKEDVVDCIICVTRWFGGVKLMGDRFRHVQDATKYAIENSIAK
jgi:putative IMPACT (imprinted ancient) family translation regulator